MESITTTDLTQFGHRELEMAEELLKAWREQGLPDEFGYNEVTIMFNSHSGYVFLTNEGAEAAMMNGDKLESWYICGECGHEGFKEDMEHEGNSECQRGLREIGVIEESEEEL